MRVPSHGGKSVLLSASLQYAEPECFGVRRFFYEIEERAGK